MNTAASVWIVYRCLTIHRQAISGLSAAASRVLADDLGSAPVVRRGGYQRDVIS